jgi:hypothetical protein
MDRIQKTLLNTLVFVIMSLSIFSQTGEGVDTTFNSIPLKSGSLSGVKIQTDGKILAFGRFLDSNSIGLSYLFRSNADGSPDNSFSCGDCELIEYFCKLTEWL